MHRGRLFFATSVAAACWLGCNALLGIESATFDPDAANEGGPSEVGSSDVVDSDGPMNSDAGPCVDIANNPNHCGRCDHGCLGGGCLDGICQPVVLASDVGGPLWLAVDATHVYWLNQASADIQRVPIAGGAKAVVFDGLPGTAGDRFLLEPNAVVFVAAAVGSGGVYRCPKAGCGAMPEMLLGSLDSPGSIARNEAGELFIAEFKPDGRLLQCAPECSTVYLVDTDGFPSHLSASTGGVFWKRLTPFPGGIRGKVLDASSPTTSLDDGPINESVAQPTRVVWARRGEGPAVYTRDGGSIRRLTSQPTESEYVAVDGDQAYFTDFLRGRVLACPLTGCPDGGTLLAGAQDVPRGIAFDEKAIYWVNGSSNDAGAVMKLAKP